MSIINIISHRGFWKEKKEQNTLESFKKAFQSGFGVETDIRDSQNELVVSLISLSLIIIQSTFL